MEELIMEKSREFLNTDTVIGKTGSVSHFLHGLETKVL